jgi:signal transduction histidine kinase/CheY-like chemotaxis protein
MRERQKIFPVRREYNRFAADQTLEDYSLRYTATAARRFSSWSVANTALGAISFLACEALGGAVTLNYGFSNAMAAILVVSAIIFATSLPISHYATKYGVDMDLLTRGAGFGYLGSTVTSLIYASFTFILFAIEGTIMADALNMCFGLPLPLSYALAALGALPIAGLGVRFISRFQLWSQPIWLVLQLAPLVYFGVAGAPSLRDWASFPGAEGGAFDLRLFGFSTSILLSLLPQIGEQVDYLRFLPRATEIGSATWRAATFAAGPGWILIGAMKLAAGSFLAYAALRFGVPFARAAQPSELYNLAFSQLLGAPTAAMALAGVFVVTCQMKINVTNAYAGSIAWSNFFSRITHNHPGRVVWLVFNVTLALLLMEFGATRVIDGVLSFYSNFAVAWIGALTADLVVNKPLGLSPPEIEFRRAYLYDVNPVGCGAMAASLAISTAALSGALGETAQPLAALIGFGVSFVTAPLIAWASQGRYYLARAADMTRSGAPLRCTVCENSFEPSDMAACPAYDGPICSLCCSLDIRCRDLCREKAALVPQAFGLFAAVLPAPVMRLYSTRLGRFAGVFAFMTIACSSMLVLVYFNYARGFGPTERMAIRNALEIVFGGLVLVMGVAAWTLVLAQESRRVAEEETQRQTDVLREEIEAHKRTDAALQQAKEIAEAASLAKTRFITGLNHEIRTPLNAINGYAQLLERESAERPEDAVRVIRRSTEHIVNLIESLLDIAKIETASFEVSRDTFRVDEALDQLADMFRLQATAKGVEFRYARSASLPKYVRADKKRLRQILINLLSNAVKFTERGHVSLKVSVRNDIAQFEVSDTGVGIRPEDIETIFAPFDRGHMPGVSSIPGTGLGLTITKSLTRIIGGELKVESEPGVGSRFTLRLYLTEAPPPHAVTAPSRIRGYLGQRKSILIADDSPEHLDFMRQILVALGFHVIEARNGAACVAAATDERPDLVILDVAMPEMSGWEAARRLRAEFPEMQILIVSASIEELSGTRGPRAPHDDYLLKPFEMTALTDRLANLLSVEWLVEPEKGESAEAKFAPPAAAPLRRAEIDELLRLADIGHSRGLRKTLDEIAGARPDVATSLAPLRGLAENFEFEALKSTLQELRAHG